MRVEDFKKKYPQSRAIIYDAIRYGDIDAKKVGHAYDIEMTEKTLLWIYRSKNTVSEFARKNKVSFGAVWRAVRSGKIDHVDQYGQTIVVETPETVAWVVNLRRNGKRLNGAKETIVIENGREMFFKTQDRAAQYLGVNRTHMSMLCQENGRRVCVNIVASKESRG